jgi:hypothetical protein
MANGYWRIGTMVRAGLAIVALLVTSRVAHGQDCGPLLSLFQQGRNTTEISRITGMPRNQVEGCRRELSKPIFVGPEGSPPLGAVGPAPKRAAGPPPVGAAGPPPLGAAGPPPLGRKVKRLP